MTKNEAIADIIFKVKTIRGDTVTNNGILIIYVEKIVNDVLNYCHRRDFPDGLIFTCVDLIAKRLADEENERAGNNDLKSLKMDDTTFEFNTAAKQSAGVLSDLDFDSIKAKLNLYRKLPGFCSCATTE